jgi:DNA-binding XRE family transcriptional regulator
MDRAGFYAYMYVMPKRPKFIHPVRAVRLTVGDALDRTLTQPAFARMVGVSASTIQSIELGRLRVSRDLANRICLVTGVDPESIMKEVGAPVALHGGPFLSTSFQLHKHFYDSMQGEHSFRKANLYLESLLRAAAALGKDNRLLAVLLSFDQWLNKTRKEFGLVKASARQLEELTETRNQKTGRVVEGQKWSSVYTFYDAENRRLKLLKFVDRNSDEDQTEAD